MRFSYTCLVLPTLTFVLLSSTPIYGFNSNLPPPWLARTSTIEPLPVRSSSANSKPKQPTKPKKSNPNEKITESSSNSGSTASTDSETPSFEEVSTTSSSKDVDVGTKSKVVEERMSETKDASISISYGDSASVSTTIPSFGISPKTSIASPLRRSEMSVKSIAKMSRVSDIFGVIFFHTIGTYLAIGSTGSTYINLLSTLLRPSMIAVLASLMLLSGSSKVVDNYYDTRTGMNLLQQPIVPTTVIKSVLTYLYTGLLTTLVFLPGKFARMSVVAGTMLTFWYTQHLQPKTWIKNVSSAGLVAILPFTSAAAASYLQGGGQVLLLTKALPLSVLVFLGIMGREIYVDVLKEKTDRERNVHTIPVKYGKRISSRIVLGLTLGMCLMSLSGPLMNLLIGEASLRRLMVGLVGSILALARSVDIVRKDGMNLNVVKKAVEEGKYSLLLLIASFV